MCILSTDEKAGDCRIKNMETVAKIYIESMGFASLGLLLEMADDVEMRKAITDRMMNLLNNKPLMVRLNEHKL